MKPSPPRLTLVALISWAIFSALFHEECIATDGAPAQTEVDPSRAPSPHFMRAVDCTVTKVGVSKGEVWLEFTGYWENASDLMLPNVGHNSLSVMLYSKENGCIKAKPIPPQVAAMLATFGADAQKLLGKKANILVRLTGGPVVTSRGGAPMIDLPNDADQLAITPGAR